jgi:hypothetical protein
MLHNMSYGNTATVDQTATTGVGVTVSGSSLRGIGMVLSRKLFFENNNTQISLFLKGFLLIRIMN